jgi:cytoskeletal protein CcmA (bactofilin family)
MKGVRKRSNKEHEAYGDATVGGEHIPGKANVVDILDSTSDLSNYFDDGSYGGGGLVWCMSTGTAHGSLWVCSTTDGTYTVASGDPTLLKMHPDVQWGGGDVTWSADHAFAGSICVAGGFYADATVDISGATSITGDVTMSGTLKIGTDLTITGDMAVDGTSNFTGATAFGGDVTIDGGVEVDGTIDFNGITTLAANVYDSSWYDATVGASETLAHNLGTANILPKVLFKAADGSGPHESIVIFTRAPATYGSWVRDISANNITVQSGDTATGFAQGAAGGDINNDHTTGGQLRVLCYRIDD